MRKVTRPLPSTTTILLNSRSAARRVLALAARPRAISSNQSPDFPALSRFRYARAWVAAAAWAAGLLSGGCGSDSTERGGAGGGLMPVERAIVAVEGQPLVVPVD